MDVDEVDHAYSDKKIMELREIEVIEKVEKLKSFPLASMPSVFVVW